MYQGLLEQIYVHTYVHNYTCMSIYVCILYVYTWESRHLWHNAISYTTHVYTSLHMYVTQYVCTCAV